MLPKVQKLPLSSPNTFDDPMLIDLYQNSLEEDADKNIFYMTDALL